MKHATKIALRTAVLLLAAGMILCAAALAHDGLRFSALSTAPAPVRQEQAISAAGLNEIRIDAASDDVRVTRSDDADIHLSWYDREYLVYRLENEGGVLSLRLDRTQGRKDWKHWINFDLYGSGGVTLAVPANFAGEVSAETDSGGIGLSDVTLGGSLTCKTNSGPIKADALAAAGATIRTVSGSVDGSDWFVAGPASCETDSGAATLKGVEAASFSLGAKSGRVKLAGVRSDAAAVRTGSGNITLDALSADVITLSARSGDIRGTIDGAETDYTVSADAVSGECSLRDRAGAGFRTLTVKTNSGDIDLSFLS